MTTFGVIAHQGKTIGGGLSELRSVLGDAGFTDPPWEEVTKSKLAAKAVERLVARGVDLLMVWGGDGTVQRCIDALVSSGAGDRVTIGIVPAGTANLLATGLGVPKDLRSSVDVALHGGRRRLDVGRANGEHFAVMGGLGFDAFMIRDANKRLKARFGRVAYILSGAKNLGNEPMSATVKIDGNVWFHGDASCILLANIGRLIGGLEAFPEASPDDGCLDVGVIGASSRTEWFRVLARVTRGRGASSPLVSTARAHRKVSIHLDRAVPWELDGGDRPPTRSLKVHVLRRAVEVCVPNAKQGNR